MSSYILFMIYFSSIIIVPVTDVVEDTDRYPALQHVQDNKPLGVQMLLYFSFYDSPENIPQHVRADCLRDYE